MSDDRDWRESAYLRASNWPEAIPEMGPQREYGPYPWGRKRHDDPHDLDSYPNCHPDAASIGEDYLGDVCPYCGVPLSWSQEVVLHDGTRGTFHDISDVGNPETAYHPDCFRERQAAARRLNNHDLEAFT